jgi:hypothetical protein
MDLILKRYFNNFKNSFEIDTEAISTRQDSKEGQAFEKFVNYTIFSRDYPEIFTGNVELLDFVCVGGSKDTGIDGIGIKVNDKLVRNIEEVRQITENSKKITVDFVFIQSKMKSEFKAIELTALGTGVKSFFSEDNILPENSEVIEFRKIKNFIYNDEKVIAKLDKNPSVFLYYVTTGKEPKHEDENFSGSKKMLIEELKHSAASFADDGIHIQLIDSNQLIKICRELENQLEVLINILDIFPLIVSNEKAVKKAYAFTCNASEFLKILEKEDGCLRSSLFNDNVRDYLGNNKSVNSEIEKTIIESPDLFLLCNNGITIVCSNFEQVRDKLVKIENPQIVNGCQTSNSLFNQKNNQNIQNVKLFIRLISTDDFGISNKIVRGTNKQNQVLDEAFETTLPFHQELENFFFSVENDVKLYYERRAKQYSNHLQIKKTQIVNLRILTQTFVSIFLEFPHKAHQGNHESTLIRQYAEQKDKRQIFREDHSPYAYYICALIWYMFEKYFREDKIDKTYKPYKAHLYLIFRMSLGEYPPHVTSKKKMENYFNKFIEILKDDLFIDRIPKILSVFDETKEMWIQNKNSPYGIKDNKEFTEMLIKQSRERFMKTKDLESKNSELAFAEDHPITHQGTILRIIHKDDHWFGFIKLGDRYEENVYFDCNSYEGNPKSLAPNTPVEFVRVKNKNKGYRAINVKPINDNLNTLD